MKRYTDRLNENLQIFMQKRTLSVQKTTTKYKILVRLSFRYLNKQWSKYSRSPHAT